MRMPNNMKKRDVMKSLRGMKENDLEKLYMEYNSEISRVRGMARGSQMEGGYKLRNYNIAVKNRARILTILNQRRHERVFRNGGHHGNKN